MGDTNGYQHKISDRIVVECACEICPKISTSNFFAYYQFLKLVVYTKTFVMAFIWVYFYVDYHLEKYIDLVVTQISEEIAHTGTHADHLFQVQMQIFLYPLRIHSMKIPFPVRKLSKLS